MFEDLLQDRKKLLTIGAVLAVLIGAWTAKSLFDRRAAVREAKLHKLHVQALEARSEHNYEESLRLLQKISEERPKDDEIAQLIASVEENKLHAEEMELLAKLRGVKPFEHQLRYETLVALAKLRPGEADYRKRMTAAKATYERWSSERAKAESAQKYLGRLNDVTKALEVFQPESCESDKAALQACLDRFAAGAKVVDDGASTALDKTQRAQLWRLKRDLASTQSSSFPQLRKAASAILSDGAEGESLVVKVSGAGFRVIEFINSSFAEPEAIERQQEQASALLRALRFHQAVYRQQASDRDPRRLELGKPDDRALMVLMDNGESRPVQ